MGKANLVIVESPAKAKTINKYLGSDFQVLASFGHVRDLVPKDGAVNPDDDFALQWDVGGQGDKHLKAITAACKEAKHLYLATDPDREGEAISWHVYEELKSRNALTHIEKIDRIVFHEITEQAVRESLQSPRPLDQKLVDAYLARRVLDYLVGFNLSPVLWRKLPGAKSAGRVQSVALRIICEREQEIEAFKTQEYWSVSAACRNSAEAPFTAKLVRHQGEELDKLSLGNEAQASDAAEAVRQANLSVIKVERKQKSRHPYAPFTTSTMQQDANRKLNFSATRTMQIAQRLYEAGLITYMRTDSTALSGQAIGDVRRLIGGQFGDNYLPEKPVFYKTKAKNAQEAHEAIRPTDFSLTPQKARPHLDKDQSLLYELIWKRAVASQMKSALMDVTSVLIESTDKQTALKTTGSVVRFDGFLKLYNESPAEDKRDAGDAGDDDEEKKILPPLNEGEAIACDNAESHQHFTQPPPRYSEAGLVKKMEEIGIGRPSTYASILKILQERDYVELDKKRFTPKARGRLVTAFLNGFFHKYVDYEFTAALEDSLDEISRGQAEWKKILQEFWQSFYANTQQALDLEFTEVRAEIDRVLSGLFFDRDETGSDEAARRCPLCDGGRLGVNYGKYGIYVNCSNYPECRYTQQGNGDGVDGNEYPRHLGDHEEQKVTLQSGPFGFYVQQGEGKKSEVKRTGLPKGTLPDDVDFELAKKLLSLPRLVGKHPDSSDDILAGYGRYGPYLKHGAKYTSLGSDDNVLEIGLNRAVEVIETKAKSGGRNRSEPLKELGDHPEGGRVALYKGPYGHYVKWQKINAGIPKDREPNGVTLEEALQWIENKQKNPSKGRAKKKSAKKTSAKKSRAKKPA